MDKHTPWKQHGKTHKSGVRYTASFVNQNNGAFIEITAEAEWVIEEIVEKANAACVNAMQGINDPQAFIAQIEIILAEIEWILDSELADFYCPICNSIKAFGHEEDCGLNAILKELDNEQG